MFQNRYVAVEHLIQSPNLSPGLMLAPHLSSPEDIMQLQHDIVTYRTNP